MASQAAVDVLIEKGRFEPRVALAVAEAIDAAMTEAQFVTIAILDARLAELKADLHVELMRLEKMIEVNGERFRAELQGIRGELKAELQGVKAELIRWVFAAMLGSTAISVAAAYLQNLLHHSP